MQSFAKRTKLPSRPSTSATDLETPQSTCGLISLHELLKSMSKTVSKAGEGAVQDQEDEEIEKPAQQPQKLIDSLSPRAHSASWGACH